MRRDGAPKRPAAETAGRRRRDSLSRNWKFRYSSLRRTPVVLAKAGTRGLKWALASAGVRFRRGFAADDPDRCSPVGRKPGSARRRSGLLRAGRKLYWADQRLDREELDPGRRLPSRRRRRL